MRRSGPAKTRSRYQAPTTRPGFLIRLIWPPAVERAIPGSGAIRAMWGKKFLLVPHRSRVARPQCPEKQVLRYARVRRASLRMTSGTRVDKKGNESEGARSGAAQRRALDATP